jgi:hypothetical protein
LQRWLEDAKGAAIEDAALTANALAALGGDRHAEALQLLRDLV